MRKEELDQVLSHDGAVPDLGPIEFWIDEIATAQSFPERAIALCAARHEESRELLRPVLIRAANGESLSPQEEQLLFYGLHILGGARDRESFQPLMRLLRRPEEIVDALLGDTVTETLSRIVAGTFDGDGDALFAVILDETIDPFIRTALLKSAAFLTWDGRIERTLMQRYLERVDADTAAEDGELGMLWDAWAEAVGLLGLRDLAPRVHAMLEEGRMDLGLLDRYEFDHLLADAVRDPEDAEPFEKARLGYIDDTLEAVRWVQHSFWDLDPISDDEDEDEELPSYEQALPSAPVTNPWRHVGRNDPCPCGSGKKAKKCCMPR